VYELYSTLMASVRKHCLVPFKFPMSHGTMKYTLKAHVYYFVLIVGLLHYLYSLPVDFYTSENIINKHIFSLMMRLTCCVRHSCCSLIYMMKETLYHRSQSLEVSKIKGKKLEKLWSSIINNFLIF
jgi:hypothetical protein